MKAALFALICTFLTGCLFKPVTVSTRHFVLSPVSTNEPASASAEHLSVGIGFVEMPSYLLRDSMAVRNGNNEIDYLENALWAERLDHSFQQTLAANLSGLLPSSRFYVGRWGTGQVTVRVALAVQQFDVDTGGQGTLIAQWRILAPDGDVPLKSGTSRLRRTGASPRGNPQTIATTLSDLTAEFSRDLARTIRECSEKPVAN
jgi:uncharacterized lipoprotein YmbA